MKSGDRNRSFVTFFVLNVFDSKIMTTAAMPEIANTHRKAKRQHLNLLILLSVSEFSSGILWGHSITIKTIREGWVVLRTIKN